MNTRAVSCCVLSLGLLTPQAHASSDEVPLPPVPVDELRLKAPQPSWDVGLLLAGCGVGNSRLWEKTRFCAGAVGDALWGRSKETEAGYGFYGQLGTAGFQDLRASLGPSAVVSLIDWFTLSLRGGGLALVDEVGVAPGVEGFVELGHRSTSYRSGYSLSHALFGGVQYTAELPQRPSSTTLWIGLRIDAIWLTAPRFLFK